MARTYVVTGASSGIGLQTKSILESRGATLSWISFPNGLLGFAVAFLASSAFAILQFVFLGKPLNRFLPFAPFLLIGLIFVEVGQFV